jgi:polyphosphate kinase
MNRNLDWRVEAIAPVEDPTLRDRLREILEIFRHHTEHSWQLHSDGSWKPRIPQSGDKNTDAQTTLMARSVRHTRKR